MDRSSRFSASPGQTNPISLKKTAVRVARPAASPKLAPPVKAEPKDEDGFAPPVPTVGGSTISKETDTLEELFARLNTQAAPSTATSAVKKPSESTQAAIKPEQQPFKKPTTESHQATPKAPAEPIKEPATESHQPAAKPAQSLELQYIHKAAECITSLPPGAGPTAELLQRVTSLIKRPYAPSAFLEPDVVEALKTRYVDAVVVYLTKTNKNKKPKTKDQIRDILAQGDGNFIFLCSVLAAEDYLKLGNLDQMLGLCKAIEGSLSKDDDTKSTSPTTAPKDSLDGTAAWPAREKRENGPKSRTAILTGLPENVSINKIQSLVSILPPELGCY